ncbi:MAG: hypothetical protein IT474_07305 [Arenimonas sp.]|nr:hypothetical protein [Arenimonas sp.]
MNPGLRLAALLLLALFAHRASGADEVTPAQQSRMADVAVRVMPIGRIMEMAAAENPAWPGSADSRLDAERLACLRDNLRAPAYRKVVERRVADYAHAEPARFAEDLTVLEGDAGRLFAKLMSAGMESKFSGSENRFDPTALLKDETPEALAQMVLLANDPRYTPLRAMLGIGAQIVDGESGRKVGQAAGLTLMLPALSDAMTVCNVRFEEL